MVNPLHIGIRSGIALAALTLAIPYALTRWSSGILLVGGVALVWLFGDSRRRTWLSSFGLIGFLSLAAFGIWQNMPPGWMILASVAALIAWDLSQFDSRLRSAKRIEHEMDLIRAHARRLLIVAAIGLAVGEIALGVQVEFSFGWALLLGLLAVWGLSHAIGFLRRESD